MENGQLNALQPDRNLAMELVRATEAGAIASARFIGKGNKEGGDKAAVDAMRAFLKTVHMDGVVVIGEGEKDEAPMLYNGEHVGSGKGPQVDVAVDPVEGTNLLALGRPNAICVVGVAERGSMWDPGPSYYMNKIVVEEKAKDAIDITLSTKENLLRIAEALGKKPSELTVFVLEKERHKQMVADIRSLGACVTLHTDGDVMGSLLAAIPGTGIDVLMGIGGTPEGVLSACAIKALRGGFQGMRAPQLDIEFQELKKQNINLSEVLTLDTLVRCDNTFFAATGITDGGVLKGVEFNEKTATTESLVIRSHTASMRYIKGIHQLSFKKELITTG